MPFSDLLPLLSRGNITSKIFGGYMKKIIELVKSYFERQAVRLLFYIILCLGSSALSFASPYITGNFIDELIVSENGKFI